MPKASPLGFSIEAKGDDAAARTLRALGQRGEDPRPVFQQISDELRAAEVHWFESRGDGSWAPLAQDTLDKKARSGQPPEPLVATGALRASLTASRGQQGRRTVTQKQMRFGTRVKYAVFHKEGRGVPERSPLVPVDARTRRRMVKDVRDYLMQPMQHREGSL
jgi:phage gpG-like protein